MMRIFGAALAVVLVCACQPQAPAPKEAPAATAQGAGSVTGVVQAVDDAGYPMFLVKVKGADGVEKSLLLNAEDADLGGAQPGDFTGKTATVAYVTEPKPNLVGLELDGKSLLPSPPGVLGGDVQTVTGVLGGAAETTVSDLPGQITVGDPAAGGVAFDWYVTPDMASANGKTVTATYLVADETLITAMKVAP